MSKLPRVSGAKVIKAMQRAGFEQARQRGSHVILKHSDGRTTVVPVHRGEDIGPGLLRKILRESEITPEEFLDLLKD